MDGDVSPQFDNLWYSFRRYYVDRFCQREVGRLEPGSRVMDLGGHRKGRRGAFDIADFPVDVVCVNIDSDREPDLVCDAAEVPVTAGSFDTVLCCELLEHVSQPDAVLAESYRVLRSGGRLLLAAPFNVNIHGHPQDYGRYTDTWYREHLTQVGYQSIEVENQGSFYTVAADMLKHFAKQKLWPVRPWPRALFQRAVTSWCGLALQLERQGWHMDNYIVSGFTTGFGVVARKP